MKKYIVMTAKEKMPNSVRSPYGKVAVVETDGAHFPKQIHPNHKAVVSIPYYQGRLNIGTGKYSAFAKALSEARKICDELNNSH